MLRGELRINDKSAILTIILGDETIEIANLKITVDFINVLVNVR